MARPPDSAPTYDSIVQQALVILAEDDDPGALSLRRVAKAAGMSLGAVQYHFATKESLLEACLDAYYARLEMLAHSLTPLVDAHSVDARVAVESAARTFFRFVFRERALVRLGLLTVARRGELSRARQERVMGMRINEAATLLGPLIGLTVAETRLSIQAFAAIIVRLSLMSDSERAHLTGHPGDAGLFELEEYAARAARRLFCSG